MKRVCQFLAFVFVFALLAGCDGGAPKTNPGDGKVDPSKKGTAPPPPPPPPLPDKSGK